VYCFSRDIASPQTDVIKRIEQVLGTPTTDCVVHQVRLVAPRKLMCCASFTLPLAAAMGTCALGSVDIELNFDHGVEEDESEEPDMKRVKR
jgi:tRNA (guanine37-N1)-methyltransferase